jgi:hypothetical protein
LHKQASETRLPSVPIPGTSNLSHEKSQTAGPGVSKEESGSTKNRHAPQEENKVSRPVSESQKTDPRQFQLNQLRTRFSPSEKEEREAIALTFKLVPTDPDFPFEMTALDCTLRIPNPYPAEGRPSLKVTNPEMDRGYQINVERGFDSLVAAMPQSTLLALLNRLDKQLEGFLMSEKAQTIKLVTNTGKKTSATTLESGVAITTPAMVSTTLQSQPYSPPPQFPEQKLADAKAKRKSDIRQLEARLGRQPLFSKVPDGLSFFVPLQIPRSSKLPISLQTIRRVKLVVPLLYNLEPCTALLVDVSSSEAAAVHAAFERHAMAHQEMTLVAHVNHLAHNMHTMAMEVSAPNADVTSVQSSTPMETARQTSKATVSNQFDDRTHIHIIPRPPEWHAPQNEAARSDSADTSESDEELSEYETDHDDGGAPIPSGAPAAVEAGPDIGVLLSFPSLELYTIELLQLDSISLTVKCDRCKETKDVKSIKPHAPGETSLIKHESCNKCANQLKIGS